MKILIIIWQLLSIVILKVLYVIFAGLRVEGKQFLETINGPVIFIANHRSKLDPFILGTTTPVKWLPKVMPYRFMTAERFMKMPAIKFFMTLWGCYPVAPGTGALEQVLRPTLDILKDPHQSLIMFPEGGIVDGGEIKPARPGIAYLARETKRLIVPVAIFGTETLTFRKFFTFKNRFIIKYGQPFYYHEAVQPGEELTKAAEQIFNRVNRLLGK